MSRFVLELANFIFSGEGKNAVASFNCLRETDVKQIASAKAE